MIRNHVLFSLTAAAAMVAAPAAYAGDGSDHAHDGHDHAQTASAAAEAPTGNIAEVAAADGQFQTLLAAAQAAGLVDALTGDKQLTVFAPTDEAFAALPDGTVSALLEDPEALALILKYHVVAGAVPAADVLGAGSLTTLIGQSAAIETTEDGATIEGASIIATDIHASNGIIHVIDAVLLPGDIVDVAAGDERFTTLVAALQAAELVETLQGEGPFTVFAPTNDAFAALPPGTVETLLLPENRDQLTAILTYHVSPGAALAADVVAADSLASVQGSAIPVQVTQTDAGATVTVAGATVLVTDIKTTNGVIHVIDSVMLPE